MLPANVFNLHLIYSPKPIMTGIWCFASANLGPRKQGSLKLDTQKVQTPKKSSLLLTYALSLSPSSRKVHKYSWKNSV